MAHRNLFVPVAVALLAIVDVQATALAQFIQQGMKLIGSGGSVATAQGQAVAVAGDGNTAIVGGPGDGGEAGAAWVFSRADAVWSQIGTKLVGSSAVGLAEQGSSVAISTDGATAIVGGYPDNGGLGAAWIYVRNGDTWLQQGSKLVGAGTSDPAWQGFSVALSADGNTAILGAPFDDGGIGSALVFVRNAGVWTQQGSKLIGSDASGFPGQGFSVALSGDGNTAVVGGRHDSSENGAVWIFVRSGGVWSQQGSKLVGTGATGGASQGTSVSIAADGNTVIVGGPLDNGLLGSAWIFVRSGVSWTQQGPKLVGAAAVGIAAQGTSTSISGDGNTVAIGGPFDDSGIGATWAFHRSAGRWAQFGSKLVSSAEPSSSSSQGTAVALSGDGRTLLVGAPLDSGSGATWVFVSAAVIPGAPLNVPTLGPLMLLTLLLLVAIAGIRMFAGRPLHTAVCKRH